jgi:signal transduction histidine kinase
VYRIGREAIVNAFNHSGATTIHASVEYTLRQLRISIRDNGCGIDSTVLNVGRDGHWGLSGMRERAESIGARLHVWSSASTGTEIELDVPGHIAFPSTERRWPLTLFSRRNPSKVSRNGRHT